jgi:hypothetical protein
MTLFNAFTGLKRKLPRRDLPRKKRNSMSSTVAARMFAEQAMKKFPTYMFRAQVLLLFLATTHQQQDDLVIRLLLMRAALYFQMAIRMVIIDSKLLDVHNDEDNSGFNMPLVGITLDSFENDDECESKTRFTRAAITTIIEALQQPATVKLHYTPTSTRYYKFKLESLVIYMLRKMSTARTHADLCDSEFGGSSARWAIGYKWILKRFDDTFFPLIGPRALEIWAPQFPYFADKILEYIQRDRERGVDAHGNPIVIANQLQHIGPGEFNVFSITDCTSYEIARPGSGPVNNNNGARRDNWYNKQRAFYDGYHRAFEACVKILTICLPNGMTAAIYGPTSGRQGDKTLHRMAEFDDFLQDLCVQHHNATLYATYGDDIFAGNWYCLRTKHKPAPGLPLTLVQEEENANMKSVRELVEWSYAKAEQNWPMLVNRKELKRVDVNPDQVWAEIRVMYLLTNFKICELEGSTMTGTRGFQCPPPTLAEYLAM